MPKKRGLLIGFFVLLVLQMSLVSAAPQIVSVSVSGSNGVEGVIQSTDALNFEVEVDFDGEAATASKLILGGTTPFTTCTAGTSNPVCTLRFPSSGTDTFAAQPISFSLALNNDAGTQVDQRTGTVVVDNRNPEVSFSSVNPTFAGIENITFSYSVSDTSCSVAGCDNICSGLDRVEFFTIDNSFTKTVDLSSETGCSVTTTLVEPSSSFTSGNIALFARAFDKFGLVSSTVSIPFEVDNQGPQANVDSFQILLNGGDLRHFVPNAAKNVIISMVYDEPSVVSAVADFSELNPSSAGASSLPGVCIANSTSTRCQWPFVLQMSSGGVKQVTINATDNNGISESTTISRSFTSDTTGPSNTRLNSVSGSSFIGTNADFVVDFTETGSGVSTSTMRLAIGNAQIEATHCSETQCFWEDVSLSTGSLTVSLSSTSSDLLGNAATVTSSSFTVSSEAPEITSIQASSVGGVSAAATGFSTIGERVAVTVNLSSESSIVNATADFSAFVEGDGSVQGSCQQNNITLFTCSFISPTISRSLTAEVPVSVTNIVGNSDGESITVQTFESLDDTNPNVWRSSARCSPEVLDRTFAELTNLKIYCQIVLSEGDVTGRVTPLSLDLAGCGSDADINADRIQNQELFFNDQGSRNALLKLTLSRGSYDEISEVLTTCRLNIVSQVNNAITSTAETEEVPIQLLFSDGVGDASDSLQEEIDAAVESTEGILDVIDVLNDIIVIAEQICNVFNVLYNTAAFLHGAFLTLKTTKDSCQAATAAFAGIPCTPLIVSSGKICHSEQTLQQGSDIALVEGVNKFCKFVNCQHTYGVFDDFRKYMNDIFSKLPGSSFLTTSSDNKDHGWFGVKNNNDGELTLGGDMDIQESLVLSTLFVCVPGVVKNLEEMRQVQCLYADCLKNQVQRDNLPLTVCEDLQSQAMCKYVFGEVFALIPYTQIFDKYMKLIKSALSDPFVLIGLAPGAVCWVACNTDAITPSQVYGLCNTHRVLNKLGYMITQVKGIIDNGAFPESQDFCDRLDEGSGNGEDDGGFLGIF